MMGSERFLTAQQAAQALGVRPSTLYAYVSRGLLSSRPGSDARSRLYLREEVEELKRRRQLRRDPTSVSREALSWGLPVLESEISLIADGGLYYRGLPVAELARERTVEEVASLLWLGDPDLGSRLFPARPVVPTAPWRRVLAELDDRHPGERLQVVLRFAATRDPTAMDLRPEALAAWGARLLTLLAATVRGRGPRKGEGLLGPLVEEWGDGTEGVERLLHGALIVCADHELNVSSFTARCVASAGASPYEAVAAGLGALRGFRHGGHSDRVEELLEELGVGSDRRPPPSPAEIRRVVEERLERGELIPGFGQPLYPHGDPRQPVLMDLIAAAYPASPVVKGARRVMRQVEALIARHPTIDFALATLSRQLGLGAGGAWTVFALGRSVGWIGHIIEEYERGRLIRPRARYVGPMPAARGRGPAVPGAGGIRASRR